MTYHNNNYLWLLTLRCINYVFRCSSFYYLKCFKFISKANTTNTYTKVYIIIFRNTMSVPILIVLHINISYILIIHNILYTQ